MDRIKIVVTDYSFPNLSIERKILAEMPQIELIEGNARTENEVIELTKEADGIINQYAPINADVLEQLKKCQVISCYGVGVNTIDIQKATEKGIFVSNVPDYCIDEVSDHALSLLLSMARKIIPLNQYMKNNIWDFKKAIPIRRFNMQTVGVLGFGRIPRKLVVKLIALGFKVLIYDPFVSNEDIETYNAHPVSLENVFEKSDFVSIHIPLTKETKGIINKDLFNISKSSLVIINTSRGEIINESDLISALQSKTIEGAALDVFEKEPIQSDNPLLNMENVILTPHMAWYSEESQEELRKKCADNVLQVFKGNLPPYLVNKCLIDGPLI